MTDFMFSQPFYRCFVSLAASFLVITSPVIVPAAGVCEMSVAFHQAARHRTKKNFESLFV
jgi:hypothetical protein